MLTIRLTGSVGSFYLDVDIEGGDGVTALYGASGAGKSTILRGMAGLWRPDSGHISIRGDVLFDSKTGKNLAVHKRRLGAVFQDPLVFPHLDVRDNLAYGMGKDVSNFDSVVALLDLQDLLDRQPRHLSGGELQRVALGRALLTSPRALLLDEPLTGLDAARREQIMPYLERIRDDSRVPIVYVSHNRDEIMRLADLVFLVEDGTVTGEMTPGEFATFTVAPGNSLQGRTS